MKTVGIRALKQNASAVVAEVARGETVLITSRGRPMAHLVPIRRNRIEEMIEAGLATPPSRSILDLPPPLTPRPGARPLSEVLAEMRDDERY